MKKVIKTTTAVLGPFWVSMSTRYSPNSTMVPRRPRLADRYIAACPKLKAGPNISAGLPAIGDLDLKNCLSRAIAKDNARHYAIPKNRGLRQRGPYMPMSLAYMLSGRGLAGPVGKLPG